MSKKPGDTFGFQFETYSSTGALTNADALPTSMVVRNGVDDATPVVTVANLSTGLYKATGTIPSGYASGDGVQVRVALAVSGVSSGGLYDLGTLDSKRVGDLRDAPVPANFAAMVINSDGLVAIDGTRQPAVRNQDAVTTPTYDDCMVGAWCEAFGKEPTFTTTLWVKQKPDNSGSVRTFGLTTDVNGNVTARS